MNQLLEIAIGGGDDPHIHRDGQVVAHPLDDLFFLTAPPATPSAEPLEMEMLLDHGTREQAGAGTGPVRR